MSYAHFKGLVVVWSPSKPSFFSKSALMSALVKCFDEFKSIVFAGCKRNSELTIFGPPVILNTMMKQIPRIVSGGPSGDDRAALDWALSVNQNSNMPASGDRCIENLEGRTDRSSQACVFSAMGRQSRNATSNSPRRRTCGLLLRRWHINGAR